MASRNLKEVLRSFSMKKSQKKEEKHKEIKYKLICEFVFRKNSLIGFDL